MTKRKYCRGFGNTATESLMAYFNITSKKASSYLEPENAPQFYEIKFMEPPFIATMKKDDQRLMGGTKTYDTAVKQGTNTHKQ